MPQSIVEMAKELTMALIQTGSISPDTMQETLQQTYATLTALKAQEETGSATHMPEAQPAPADWQTSITRHAIMCLECGQTFKQLSRHLRLHGLDPRSYRRKHAIPPSQQLAAKALTARRREVVRESRPWEKAPTYRKGQARHGRAAPEPAIETEPEVAEEPIAAAPTQPKRRRQTTTPKKAARKKRVAG
jgi:predicted transcriptional regulator